MKLKPREYGFVAIAVLIALGCIRLGFWQLSRLNERRARNALVSARLRAMPVTVDQLPRDTAQLRFRRVVIDGRYDYDHQIVLTSRSRYGSPGVNVITPVRVAGSDTAMLVNRGWVYAADGASADLTPWHEGDTVRTVGFAVPPTAAEKGGAVSPARKNAYRWLDTAAVRASIPYPIYPFIVTLETDPSKPHDPKILPRVEAPALDEGQHLSYALQWFSFAAIGIVGVTLLILRSRRAV